MPGQVTHYHDVAAFLARAESLLVEDEALNGLMLGVVSALQRQTQPRRRHAPLLATVDHESQPVLAAVMTGPHRLLLSGRVDIADELLTALAADFAQQSRSIPSVFGPAPLTSRLAQAWSRVKGAESQLGMRQRLYEARVITYPPLSVPGRLRPATDADSDQLSEWVWAFQLEALPEESGDLEAARLIVTRLLLNNDLFVWDVNNVEVDAGVTARTGQIVSMAARARPTSHGIAVNLVYTPSGERGKGYASACVAALSQLLLDSGWSFCTLFTDRANATANHIYERIGYRPLADFDEYRFQ